MPKTPQDHKPKAKAPAADDTTTTITVRGVEYVIDTAALDDFELMDDLRTLDSGRMEAALVMPRVLRAFLGGQYGAALDSLRDPATGRVPIEAGAQFIKELLGAVSPN